MSKILPELIITVLALTLLVFSMNFIDSNLKGISIVAEKTDGLEKVDRMALVNSPSADNLFLKGGDVIGSIRYYEGVSNYTVEVIGWGSSVKYGVGCSGCKSGSFSQLDFPYLSSELDFYNSQFKAELLSNGSYMRYTKQ